MPIVIRDATPADADLLAWVQVEAGRSGKPIGFWDLALPGPDEPRLRLVADLATSTRPHFGHFGGFLVAEVDGEPVAALSGYAPAVKKVGHFVGALDQTLTRHGWSEAHRRLLDRRILPAVACFSDAPADRWIVEWVAAKPQARGKGIAARLIDAILDRGRAAGFTKAQISYLSGNEPARRAYARAGFADVDSKTNAEFEAIVGAPGTVRMWKDL